MNVISDATDADSVAVNAKQWPLYAIVGHELDRISAMGLRTVSLLLRGIE